MRGALERGGGEGKAINWRASAAAGVGWLVWLTSEGKEGVNSRVELMRSAAAC